MILSTGKLLLRLLAAVTAGFAMILVVVGWLLWSGPISLGFLTPYLRDALNMGVHGVEIDLEDTILAWADWERTLDIRVRGVRIIASDEQVVVRVPEMSLGISGIALLDGRVAPTRIDLLGPKIRLVRDKAGKLGIGPNSGEGTDAGVFVAALLEELKAGPRTDSPTEFLTRVSVRNADITIVDQVFDQTWRAKNSNISFARGAGGIVGDLSALVDIGGKPTPVSAIVDYSPDSRKMAFRVDVTGLEPKRLSGYHPRLAVLDAVRASFTGEFSFTLGPDGVAGPVVFDFAGDPGHLRLPQFYDEDLDFRQIGVRGQIRDNLSAIRVDELYLDTGRATATLNGLIEFDDQISATVEGTVEKLPVDDLERYWPYGLSQKARDWVTTRVRGGTVTRANVRLFVSPESRVERGLRDDALDLTFEFEGVSARYLRSMPKLVDAHGSARMSGGTIDLVVNGGRIGEIAVSEGTVRIEGLNQRQRTASIGFVASGSVADALSLLDREPYGFARSIGLEPLSTAGLSAARIRFDFPLKADLKGSQVRYAAAANLREFEIPKVMGDHRLSDGRLLIQIDANGMNANGTAAIDGVSVDLEWHRAFRPKGTATSRLLLSAILDDAGRQALGLPSAPRVAGTTPVSAEVLTKGWEILEIAVTADLSPAQLDIPELIWSKQPGQTAGARFDVVPLGSGSGLVASFALSAPGLSATGQAELDGDNAMRRLDLSLLEVGESSVSASVRPRVPEGYIVALEGSRFDMRPYLARLFGADDPLTIPPLVLSMRVGEVILGDRHSLSEASGRAVYSGTSWQEMEATGELNGGAPVEISLLTEPGRRKLSVHSTNAGAFVRALGVFDNSIGGRLRLGATIDETLPGRPVRGEVEIDEFKVINAPVLARILTVGSLTGLADLLNGEGISFVKFEAPFVLRDGRLVISGARAFGPALGITLEGVLDRNVDKIDMKGTLVPAYTLNSVLGNIPLLGNIFVGRKGEGVFAITYSARGPVAEPTVTVNPLSALAPGFLRSIVSGGAKPVGGEPVQTLEQGE